MSFSSTSVGKYDAIIVGAGHNGLVNACFLQRAGLRVLVVEKNHPGRHASGVNAGGVRRLGRHPADLGIHAAAEPGLARLVEALGAGGQGARGAPLAAATREAALTEIGPAMAARVAVLEAIRDTLPGAIIVGDSTQAIYAGNLCYDHDRPAGWFNAATGFGALGYAIPAAIGAALAAPSAPVVCLAGDGGAQFTLPELMTAVDEKLPIRFLIWNNRAYQEIADAMQAAGIEVIGCNPTPPDFAAVEASCAMTYLH